MLGPQAAGTAEPEVTIRYGAVAPPPPDQMLPLGLWRSEDEIGIDVAEVGRYLIRGGREILADVRRDADPRSIRLYLLGTAMGALMMQRGTLVLHGNSFRVGDAAAVVLGRSGSGKSTLAAEMSRRGYDVLSDDVVPIDRHGLALPGYPRIKLWDDALDRLGQDRDRLEQVHPSVEKFQVPLRRGDLPPLPLRWIYVLERHSEPDLRLEPAQGAVTFALLHEHTYRNELVHGARASAEHLEQCARVLGRARVSRVLRPAGTMTPESTADAILADVSTDQSGAAAAPNRP